MDKLNFKRLQENYMTQVTRIFCDMAYEDFKLLSKPHPNLLYRTVRGGIF